MPQQLNKLLLITLSLILGLTIDIFSHTQGAHASACLLICYVKFLWENKNEKIKEGFSVDKMPMLDFIIFITPLTIMHHFMLFFLERFSFKEIIPIIILTVSSSCFTILLLIIHKSFMPKK